MNIVLVVVLKRGDDTGKDRENLTATVSRVGVASPATAQQKITSGKAEAHQIERGRCVVKIGGCNDCHTANYGMTGGKIPESQWLMGDTLGPAVRFPAAPQKNQCPFSVIDY